MRRFLFLVIVGIIFVSSIYSQEPVTNVTAKKIVPGSYEDLISQADKLWKERGDLKKITQSIEFYGKAYELNPSQSYYPAWKVSRGYYFIAEAFYRNNKEKMLENFEKGYKWGLKSLQTSSVIKNSGKEWYKKLDSLGKDYIDGLYWTAVNLGKWSKLYGLTKSLFNLPKVKGLIRRVEALDRDYFYGAVDRYWGVYYAAIPGFLGGSVSESQKHFLRSLKIAPGYLETKVLYAENYAVKTDDKKLFEKLLKEVISADPTVYPDIIPEQKVSIEKAKELLAKEDDLF